MEGLDLGPLLETGSQVAAFGAAAILCIRMISATWQTSSKQLRAAVDYQAERNSGLLERIEELERRDTKRADELAKLIGERIDWLRREGEMQAEIDRLRRHVAELERRLGI